MLWVASALTGLGYAALVCWLLVSPLFWILKDGLGPDAGDTTGWAALRKFSPVLFVGMGLIGYLMLMHLWLWYLGRPAEPRGGSVAVDGE
jgi:hypothetical protein